MVESILKRHFYFAIASVTIAGGLVTSGTLALAAGVPVLAMKPAMAVTSGDAFQRLTSVVPVVASCTAPPDKVDLELSGTVTNAGNLPFHAKLRILAGPSFRVDDEVSNMIGGIDGTFEFGDSVAQNRWTVTEVRDGHLFPKSYFLNGDDLRIMLPMEFRKVAGGQGDASSSPLQGAVGAAVRAIFVLRCDVEDQGMRCTSLKSVFGDVLNERMKSMRAVSELIPVALVDRQLPEPSSGGVSRAGTLIHIGCCVGETRCSCEDCEGVRGPPVQCNQFNCPNCMSDGCDACIEVGCPPC